MEEKQLDTNDNQERGHKRAEEEESTPPLVHDDSNWLVSYADMMTLLMGFFVLLYAYSRVDRERFDIVSKEVAKYFGGKVQDMPSMRKVLESIEKIMSQAGLKDGVEVVSTDSGIILKFNGSLLFKPGSAELLPEMYPIMTQVIKTVQAQKKVEEVRVEGHTDDDPISSPVFPTNWELSAARASNIVRRFEAAGYNPEILVAEGYGASRPAVPNYKEDKMTPIPENKAINRRVVINIRFAGDIDSAASAINSNDFSERVPTPPPPHENVTQTDPDAEKPMGADERLKAAQLKMQEAQDRLKAAQEYETKMMKAQDMESKIKEIERKAYETEVQAARLRATTRLPSSNSPSTTIIPKIKKEVTPVPSPSGKPQAAYQPEVKLRPAKSRVVASLKNTKKSKKKSKAKNQ